MKKKTTPKKKVENKNQVVEIHIYVHAVPNFPNDSGANYPPYNPLNPPYIVTC